MDRGKVHSLISRLHGVVSLTQTWAYCATPYLKQLKQDLAQFYKEEEEYEMSNALVVIPEKPVKEHIDNTEAVAAHRANGGGLFHVRPRRLPNGKWTRGFTVAYKMKGSRIDFATSVQHRADVFCKKVGTKVALQHFNDGKIVTLPFKSMDTFSCYLEYATV